MATFLPKESDYAEVEIEGEMTRAMKPASFARFNPIILGLGDLKQPSTATDAIAAMFDLQGFTQFGKQIEPHLSVPVFLHDFLNWLMDRLKEEMKRAETNEGVALWSPLPFFVKFMGDGLLVLWDSSQMDAVERKNIVVSMYSICDSYSKKFVKTLRKKLVDPPPVLRCGVARGTVYSVGSGNDFVGSCINMAMRLQKCPGVTFAVNRRGFEFEEEDIGGLLPEKLVVRAIAVRGIGDNELVAILKSELDAMSESDKRAFRAV